MFRAAAWSALLLIVAGKSGGPISGTPQLYPSDGDRDYATLRAQRKELQAYFSKLRQKRMEVAKEDEVAEEVADEISRDTLGAPAKLTKLKATRGKLTKLEKESESEEGEEAKEGGEAAESKQGEGLESEHEEESESEGGEGGVAHEGSLFAMTMLGTVSLLLIVVGMSLSADKTVRVYTVAAVDNIVAVFMAVLVFQATDEFIEELLPAKHHQTLAHGAHAVVILLVIYIISFELRKNSRALAIFCASAAHYGSFASMGFATTMLAHHWADNVTHVMMGLGVIVVMVFITFWVMELVRSKMSDDDEWRERIDDVANDFGAMATAVVWSLLVRTLIAGEFHHVKTDPETEGMHTPEQRRTMLIYGCCTVPFAAAVVSTLNGIKARLPESHYWKKRTIMFATSFCSMSVAWAFLLWGQWQFASYSEERSEIFCKTAFALAASFATVVGIVLLAKLGRGQAVSHFRPVRNVLLASLSLLVGWGWEQAFDAAVETIAEESANPAREKIIVAVGLCCVVIPVYAMYLKPFAMECEEAIEKGEDDDEPARA
jgi:hypothetical protein